MLGRSFLIGIAVGIAVGIYIAPSLRTNLDLHTDEQKVASLAKQSYDAIWPDDETAGRSYFDCRTGITPITAVLPKCQSCVAFQSKSRLLHANCLHR